MDARSGIIDDMHYLKGFYLELGTQQAKLTGKESDYLLLKHPKKTLKK